MKMKFHSWTYLLVLCLVWPSALAANKSQPLTVFAAASLKESLDEATLAYKQQTGR